MDTVSYRHLTGTGASRYERDFVPAIAAPVSIELLRVADPHPGERVLDVGCGTGVIARRVAVQVGPKGSVAGIDLAPDMIELAESLPAPAGAPIDWHCGDATSLPFADGSFDLVLCQMSLMFMPDRPAAVGEMHRVLADGGRVVVSTPGSIQPPFALMEEAITDHISADLAGFVGVVFSMHEPAPLATLLQEAGFSAAEASTYTATLDLPGPAEFLWQYINLTPMGPFVAEAPDTAQAALEAQVVESWRPHVVDGRTRVDQPMVLATGARAPS